MPSMKRVEKVYLVYENMEGADIPLEFIGHFRLDEITQNINRYHIGAPGLFVCANEFFIEIDRSFDREKLEQAKNYNSITSVIIDFDTGDEEEYFVPWGEKRFKNDYQTTRFNKHGDLFIVISKNPQRVEECMNPERIDADNFRLHTIVDLYDVKDKTDIETKQSYVIGEPLDDETHISALDLSVRAYNCLIRAGICDVGNLRMCSRESLTKVRNIGLKGIEEIINCCEANGIQLAED